MAIIHIIRTPATPEQIVDMLQVFGNFIKLAVDVDRAILAGGGNLHADCENCKTITGETMIDEKALKERYLRDGVPTRLGNLASSIKRLGYFVGKKKHDATVHQLFQECRFFSEWTAPDASRETQAGLAALQRDLDSWQKQFQNADGDESRRAEINAACEQWSNRILELSGLLKAGVHAHRSQSA